MMHPRRLLALSLAASVGVAALAGLSQLAQASVGVGIQVGPVRLAGKAHRGTSYALPPLYIVNTGTQTEAISVRVQRLARGPDRIVPPSWIHGTGRAAPLAAGKAARIPLELVVPASARPGGYASDIVVTGSALAAAGAADLGVAAATKLDFAVSPVPAPGTSSSLALSLWWALIGLILLALAVSVVRRSGIRIRSERAMASSAAGEHRGRTA